MVTLKEQLIRIPQSQGLKLLTANRYDTHDEYVLHLWDDEGHSYDLRVKKE